MTIPIGVAIISLLVGFLIHLIGKYWGEDGTFAENFWSKRTARYVVFTALTLVGSLIAMYYAGPELQLILGLGAIGTAAASTVSNFQKVTGDKSPASKRAMMNKPIDGTLASDR